MGYATVKRFRDALIRQRCNFDASATDDNGSCLQSDECGICGGQGIPSGNCDCAGNQLDALGECGGPCEADVDADGICDDVDPCVGELDACGECNGPGEIYDCGCSDIPEGDCDCNGNVLDECGICGGDGIPAGDCDCDGNQLDALGECGGPCEADADADGICDDADPCVGELDACGVCNGPGTIYECGCSDIPEGDCDCDGNQLDALGECGGPCEADADVDGICDDVDGCIGEVDTCGVCNGPGPVYACGCSPIAEGSCDCDGNQLDALGQCGGPCNADTDADGICDDVDDCIGELDGCGICNGPGPVYDCGCSDISEGDCDCEGNQLDALGDCGGPCEADTDADGICDDIDECVGELDDCGICNGLGAIYDCGCSDIPEGACDCDGNQLDALGECGGPCSADADMDGICDDVDDCVGAFDACGICNGPGAIYTCGCAPIIKGNCDCDGNELDALGECGGPCEEDADIDGICDDIDQCVGYLDDCGICNGPGAIYDCGCSDIPEGDCDCDGNQLDALGDCGGPCGADADADGICDDIDECVGELDDCGICNGPGAIYDCGCSDIPEGDCDCDGNQLDECFVCGGGSSAGCADPAACNYDSEAGCDNGSCTYIADGDCDCEGNQLDALGECGGPCVADADMDGICDDIDPCVGELDACGVCNGLGEIYECGCVDMPEGDCDCDGNQLDALGECGGPCAADVNDNGICDTNDVYGCTASIACNYDPEATFNDGSCDFISCLNFGCTDPGACNYDENADFNDGSCVYAQLPYGCNGECINDSDEDGICDELEIPGCTDTEACNYSALATDDAGNCVYPESGYNCDGICLVDEDLDGVCDDVDPCVGELDACGVCNGPGEIYECGCADIPEGDCDCDGNVLDECGICGGDGIPAGDCDCDGNQLDALGECGGPCEADADADGICDDVDPCVGELDACGVCNGPGEIYECGCADIPEGDCDCDGNVLDECGICGGDGIPAGDCDCDGNQLDALGECGGPCEADADADGICDDVDPCVGELDACGVCNGPGEIYECGCADIPEGDCDCDGNVLDECGICGGDGIPAGDCDCDGNQLDALGECGGPCEADADSDGICDDVDPCVGELDACGVCNGPGEIYECGCDRHP